MMTRAYAGFKLRQRIPTSARRLSETLPEGLQRYRAGGEASIAQPFKGITADGAVVPDLFAIAPTGVSTGRIREAADELLASLSAAQRARALFAVDSDAWRRWSNIHPFMMRHGVCLDEMTREQRDRALTLVRESLSARGFETARGVMKLNEVVNHLTNRPDEYGEWLYWVSVMGTPSADEPWGWQIDGHHLIVNCFVLRDQLVMTPMFMGSEPVAADDGPYAGTEVFRDEETNGLTVIRALTPEQRARATLGRELPGEIFTAAFRDNFEMKYDGVRYGDLGTAQQRLLAGLIDIYVGRIRGGHAEIKAGEIERHLRDTYFAWIGGTDDESVFYYRVHSPVILIEFDHQRGIAFDNDEPSRNHIHTVIRTPNGNDYGRDLLRQHHQQFDHARGGHRH